jgi:hypothetical protein
VAEPPDKWERDGDDVVVGGIRYSRGMRVLVRPVADGDEGEPRPGAIEAIHRDEVGRTYFSVRLDPLPGAAPAASPVYVTPSEIEPAET